MKLEKVLHDWVIVEILEEPEENKMGDLVLAKSTDQKPKRFTKAKVIAKGEGFYYNGVFVKVPVEKGNFIIFDSMAMRIELDEEKKIFAMKPSEIISIIEE